MDIIMFILVLIISIIILLSSIVVVKQQSLKIVQRLGKFNKIANAGINFKIPLIDYVEGELDLKIRQLIVHAETKTKDNVFVRFIVSVQFSIIESKAFDAFYKLKNANEQIESFIYDVIRSQVPKMTLDESFEKKDDIAIAVKNHLKETMEDFGYNIYQTLVIEIDPDEKVKLAMNEINASERLKIAAENKGEAAKIMVVKNAEAEAESKKLQGEGIANQRKAIISGLKEAVEDFKSSIDGTTEKDVMNLVLLTQYFDTLKEIGTTQNTHTIMIPHSPSGMKEISDQIRESVIIGNQIKKH